MILCQSLPNLEKEAFHIVKLMAKDPKKLLSSITLMGYTQVAYAQHVGISPSCLNYILKKKKNPSPSTAKKIADGLNKKVSDIFLTTC